MREGDLNGSVALEDMMEHARRHALLDEWDVDEGIVRLVVGTYAIELRPQAAERFVGGLLKNYETAFMRRDD